MNDIFLSILLACGGAQAVKIVLALIRSEKLCLKHLIITGGMPSSHSALVVSLATSIYLTEGLNTAFWMSIVFGFIVIRDAFGVRRTAGVEGDVIKKLLKKNKIKADFHYDHGHTPAEVFVGSVLGFIVAILVCFI